MRHFRRILLFVALVFALILSVAVYMYMDRQVLPVAVDLDTYDLLVATEDISEKSMITEALFTKVKTTDFALYQNSLTNPDDIIGRYAKNTIYKGEVFRLERLMDDLIDELSFRLPETYRAMSINVTQSTGVSDLVKVGDYVDIIVALPEIKETGRVIRPSIAKMILQRLEVLAVDRQRSRTETYREELFNQYTLTLSVPIYDTETLVLAQAVGEIQVALRPYDSDYMYPTPGVIWEDLLLDSFGSMKDLFPQYEIAGKNEIEGEALEIERYQHYTVLFGDTLRSIATKFYGDPNLYVLIKDVNQIADEHIINTGMALKIPILKTND
jgi:pilus assembly protein CpaB